MVVGGNIKGTLLKKWTTVNIVTVQMNIKGGVLIVSNACVTPGVALGPMLQIWEDILNTRKTAKCIFAGDINAKSSVWGGDTTCSRGEEVLDFVLANGLTIANESSKLPTFETSNGCSWIDLTITKNFEVSNWDVDPEESLSDHRYIKYDIQFDRTKEGSNYPRYNFKKTNWERFVEFVLSNIKVNTWDNLNNAEAVETHGLCRTR